MFKCTFLNVFLQTDLNKTHKKPKCMYLIIHYTQCSFKWPFTVDIAIDLYILWK